MPVEYGPHYIRHTIDLGSFGGSSPEFDVDAGTLYFVLESRSDPWDLDEVFIQHDGVNAAGNTFEFGIWRVPAGTTIATALGTASNRIASDVVANSTGYQLLAVSLPTTTIGNRFAAYDRMIVTVSSITDQAGTESYNSSSIDNVSVTFAGRSWLD